MVRAVELGARAEVLYLMAQLERLATQCAPLPTAVNELIALYRRRVEELERRRTTSKQAYATAVERQGEADPFFRMDVDGHLQGDEEEQARELFALRQLYAASGL
eukprot:m.2888 g.2888  ORF g.2888 m.2888 type:complete len:105 (-) comp1892_c0_seq1:104-418(-)